MLLCLRTYNKVDDRLWRRCTVWPVLNHPDSIKITRTVLTKSFRATICVAYMLRQQQLNQEINQAIYEKGLSIT